CAHATPFVLLSLAGRSARFRFRIATDEYFEDYGWFIDDLRLYTCDVGGTVQLASAAYAVAESAKAVTLTLTRSGGLADGASVDYATADGSATTPRPLERCASLRASRAPP